MLKAYLDTNIIGLLTDKKLKEVSSAITKGTIAPVLSLETFSDLRGDPKCPALQKKLKYLNKLRPTYLIPQEIVSGPLRFASNTATPSELWREMHAPCHTAEAFEQFSVEGTIHLHRGKSAKSLDKIQQQLLDKQQIVDQELERLPSSAPFLKKGIVQYLHECIHQTAEFSHDEDANSFCDELAESHMKAGSVEPPQIIDQICKLFNDPENHKATLFPLLLRADYLTLIQQAQMLAQHGFAKDKRTIKADVDRARKGANSQKSDHAHIAFGLSCDMFITQDKCAARMAYALREHHNIPCIICFIDNRRTAHEVGENYWP